MENNLKAREQEALRDNKSYILWEAHKKLAEAFKAYRESKFKAFERDALKKAVLNLQWIEKHPFYTIKFKPNPTEAEAEKIARELYYVATSLNNSFDFPFSRINKKIDRELVTANLYKGLDSIAKKIMRKGGDYSKITDFQRIAIVIDFKDLKECLSDLKNVFKPYNEAKIIIKDLNTGYKGIHLNYKQDLIPVEVQIHSVKNWEIKKQMDAIYSKLRGDEGVISADEYLRLIAQSQALGKEMEELPINDLTSLKGIEVVFSNSAQSERVWKSNIEGNLTQEPSLNSKAEPLDNAYNLLESALKKNEADIEKPLNKNREIIAEKELMNKKEADEIPIRVEGTPITKSVEVEEGLDSNFNLVVLGKKTIFNDEKGNLVKEIKESYDEGKLVTTETIFYDKDGKTTKHTIKDKNGSITEAGFKETNADNGEMGNRQGYADAFTSEQDNARSVQRKDESGNVRDGQESTPISPSGFERALQEDGGRESGSGSGGRGIRGVGLGEHTTLQGRESGELSNNARINSEKGLQHSDDVAQRPYESEARQPAKRQSNRRPMGYDGDDTLQLPRKPKTTLKEKTPSGEKTTDTYKNAETPSGVLTPSQQADLNQIFKITNLDNLKNPQEIYKRNKEALIVLRDLLKSGEIPTQAQKEKLFEFRGYGKAFKAVIDTFLKDEAELNDLNTLLKEIGDLLPQEENKHLKFDFDFTKLARGNADEFFTPIEIIKPMVSYIKGIRDKWANGKTLSILEPSAGSGRFIGQILADMPKSKIFGVELNKLSAAITKKIFPQATIENAPFQKAKLNMSDKYDVAIGNPPYSSQKIEKHLIHDYFMLKSLDNLADGGISL
ncbi:MAG: N-6 DNA methylase [Helicobacteraceae bacterium]|nr:N-6 DNA methylase [Helicobacteraceae bacterium]